MFFTLIKNNIAYTIFILVFLLAFPFLFVFGLIGFQPIKNLMQLLPPVFFQEYFKWLGTLLTVLAGAGFAESLLNTRLAMEKQKENNRLRSYFFRINKLLLIMNENNSINNAVKMNSIYKDVEMLSSYLDLYFSNDIFAAVNTDGLGYFNDFLMNINRLQSTSGDKLYKDEELKVIIKCTQMLSKEEMYG